MNHQARQVLAQRTETGPGPSRQERAALARHTAELLGGLGTEAPSVADALTEAGVQGLPADARQCALAVYLRAVMQGDERVTAVRVFHDRVVVGTPGRFRQSRVVVPLPAALRSFVAGFDAQHYPALVRRRGCTATDAAIEAPSAAPADQASAS
jgi:hypothetical protein